MGMLKFRGCVWMEQIGSKWLYNGLFLMYSTPDIIALIGEVQKYQYNILLPNLLDTEIYNLLYYLWDSKKRFDNCTSRSNTVKIS